MTLYEHIKQMTLEEMAQYLVGVVVIGIGEPVQKEVIEAMYEAARESLAAEAPEMEKPDEDAEAMMNWVREKPIESAQLVDMRTGETVMDIDPEIFAQKGVAPEEKSGEEGATWAPGGSPFDEIVEIKEPVEDASPEAQQHHDE